MSERLLHKNGKVIHLERRQRIFSGIGTFLTAPPSKGCLDGRWIILVVSCLYFSFVWYWASVHGWVRAWHLVHVPIPVASFVDCRAVLQAVDHYRQGIPIPEIQTGRLEGPQQIPDPHHYPMAYPALWLYLLAPTGLSERDTTAVSITLAVLCLTGTLAFVGRLSPGEGCLYTLLLLSPAVMYSVERGNVDLVLYLGFIAACALLAQGGAARIFFAQSIILLMAMLKIYPIAAAASGLRRRGGFISAVLTLLGFAIYCVIRMKDLHHIASLVPRKSVLSFGVRVALERVAFLTNYQHHRQVEVAAHLILLGVLLWAFLSARRNSNEFPLVQDVKGTLFLCGSLIFFINFFLGNSAAYRARFFLFLLPQLLAWSRMGGLAQRRTLVAIGTITAIVYLLGAFSTDWLGDLLCWWLLWQLAYLFTVVMKQEMNGWFARVGFPVTRAEIAKS